MTHLPPQGSSRGHLLAGLLRPPPPAWRFLRRFRLPENAKLDQVKAGMENGVLTVTVPKVDVKKPDVKPVQITEG